MDERTASERTVSGRGRQRLADLVRLRRVRDRIDREYARPLDVPALARGVHWSAGHLSREFTRAFGESPYSYLMTRRVERAMALLRRGDLSVTDVCFAVGSSSLGTFTTRFTELVGMPPGVYRERARSAAVDLPSCVTKVVTRPIRRPAPDRSPRRPAARPTGQESRSRRRSPGPSVNDMDITIHHAFLPHTDAEAALGFYRDLLGFELRNDVGYHGLRWLTVGPPGQPTSLVLTPPAIDPGLTDDERRVVLELIAKGSYATLTLGSSDLDGLFERLAAADVDIVQEPTDQPYGVRDCAVRDPAGNLLRINQVA